MKMLNSNICCKNLDEITEKKGNFIVATKNKSYKTLQVVDSGEIDEIKVGKTIYVPKNSGNDVEIGGETWTIVRASDIILILD
jgi:co-chaperonin GroES (HSP10)